MEPTVTFYPLSHIRATDHPGRVANIVEDAMKHKNTAIEMEDVEEPVRALIVRAQNGDQEAFRELVETYRTRVASIAYGLVGNFEDARDIAQEVFIKVYRALDRFDINKKFFTWLYRLSINASIDFLRANRKRSFQESIESNQTYSQYPDHRIEADLEQAMENLERREIFQQIVDELNPRQKMAFVLCDLQGLSSAEAAEIIDCPQVTLRWYLHEARKKIRAAVQNRYPEYYVSGKKAG